MNAQKLRHLLLADLYWLEYLDILEDLAYALRNGRKADAVLLSIVAYKYKSRSEYHLSKILFG